MVPKMATAPIRFLSVAVILFAIFAGTYLLESQQLVDAAHPRRRVTMRRQGAAYDREITTFNEDGRLAQVEYGLEASLRGSMVGAIKVRLDEAETDGDDCDGESVVSSCVVVCIEKSSFGKMHRIDDHLWMLTAGLSGDARMLADQARRACQNHRLRYGEAPTTLQAAQITAEFYHRLTRLGGCRPMGCSSILVGVDPTDGAAKLVRTDPGGGFEECTVCAAGNRQDKVGKELAALVALVATRFENDQENCTGMVPKIATTVTEKILRLFDGNEKAKKGKVDEQRSQQQEGTTTLDVWTIQPMKHRRGGMLATCYSDVRKDNFDKIMALHTRK